MQSMLRRRNMTSDRDFLRVFDSIETLVSRDALEEKCVALRKRIWRVTRGYKTAVAWSGGKDSLVLWHLCMQAGVYPRGVLGITKELEYPVMDEWYHKHIPSGVSIVRQSQHTWSWLQKNPQMLFPLTSSDSDRWRRTVWQAAQNAFCEQQSCRMIILGRRILDENYCGPRAAGGIYTAKGVVRFLPLLDWTHEEILAYIHYHQIAMPPVYDFPNGFKEGTHPWPARLATLDQEDGWAQTYASDPSIVEKASHYFPSAAEYLVDPTPIKSLDKHVWSGRVLGKVI